MSSMRYLLSLGVNLALAIAGGTLVRLGGTALASAVTIYQALESPAGQSRQRLMESFGLPGQLDMSFYYTVVPFIFSAGLLIVGGTLLVIGLRGLYKRIAAGLPAENEDDPTTEAGRIGQMILYGFGAAFGLWGLTLGALDNLSYLILSASGMETIAEIETIRTQNGTRDDSPPGVYFDYHFTTTSGESVTGSQLVPSSEFSRTNRDGGRIPVIYDFGNPQTHDFPQFRDWWGIAWFMAFRLLLAGIGIWGLSRVLRMGRIDGQDAHPETV